MVTEPFKCNDEIINTLLIGTLRSLFIFIFSPKFRVTIRYYSSPSSPSKSTLSLAQRDLPAVRLKNDEIQNLSGLEP